MNDGFFNYFCKEKSRNIPYFAACMNENIEMHFTAIETIQLIIRML